MTDASRSAGPGRGLARFGRGFLLAQVCLALSAGAHAAAEGTVHLTDGMLFAWLLLSALCVAAAERRRNLAGIATVVVVSQVVLHLLAPISTHDVATAAPSAEMIGWHVVAALLASLLLAHGERLAWAVWSLAGPPRVPLTLHPVPAVAGPAPVGWVRRVPVHGRVHSGGATRRGPPVA
ncbi:hypothetical protein E1212_16490 [Jiangella ureilytica]|uniref:Uncharacterized protein n=1 Tax=Jiangella ureilytica TaxID=2530374 RepID=A0A4R4RK71_9ACTN|nr:hypothetical protein [Jiangella ureilytica]TDC50018.1 hypothetical protein E1212_16490 [Jiangella ureilytica]